MATVKKLTEQELEEIKQLREENSAIAVELGQVELAKLEIARRREAIEAFLKTSREKELALVKELEETYGKGSINLETGEITLDEIEATPVEEAAE
jgi:hypothetical protein